MRVFAEPHDGAEIASTTWRDRRGQIVFAPFHDPSDLSGANWRGTIPTADLPEGPFTGSVSAMDNGGRESEPVATTFTVIRTVSLSPTRPWGSTVDDLAFQQFELRYAYADAVRNAYPVQVAILVDDSRMATDRNLDRADVNANNNSGIASVETNYRLPAGSHRVSIEVTDNRGLVRALSYDVSIGATVTGSWTGGAGADLVSGDTQHLTATVRTSGVDLLDCRVLTDERKNLPVSCTRGRDGLWTADTRVPLSAEGPRTVQLQFTPSRGSIATLDTTVTVIPRATPIITSASATAGRRYTMTGDILSTGPDLVGAVVELQTRANARGSWVQVATASSGKGGALSFSLTSNRSADYRLVPHPKPGVFGGGPGPIRFVKVVSTVSTTSKTGSVRAGKSATVRAATKPSDAGAKITLQRYRTSDHKWIALRSTQSASGGKITISYKPTTTAKYRLARSTSSAAGGSTSASFTIKVTKH